MNWDKREWRARHRAAFSSPIWPRVRQTIWDRAGHRCEECGKASARGWVLQVHHLTYAHLGNEIEHLDDLKLLCVPCHSFEHPGRNLGPSRRNPHEHVPDLDEGDVDWDLLEELVALDEANDVDDGCPFDTDHPSGDGDDSS